MLSGLGPIDAVKTANVLGWQNVCKIDSLSGIEDWPATLKMVHDDHMPRNALTLEDPGWQFLDSDQVFLGPHDKFMN